MAPSGDLLKTLQLVKGFHLFFLVAVGIIDVVKSWRKVGLSAPTPA